MGETDKLDVIIAQLNELKGMPEKVNEVMDGFKNFRIEVNSWRNGVDASLNEVKQSLESSHAEMSVLKTSLGTKARYADFKTLRDDMYRENLRERISSHKQNLIFEAALTGLNTTSGKLKGLYGTSGINAWRSLKILHMESRSSIVTGSSPEKGIQRQ